MSHDVATGTIEMVLDHFTEESEGTYTVQIQDGRGKAQSTLVLIGDGEVLCVYYFSVCVLYTKLFSFVFQLNA